jgi:hypothetical protein
VGAPRSLQIQEIPVSTGANLLSFPLELSPVFRPYVNVSLWEPALASHMIIPLNATAMDCIKPVVMVSMAVNLRDLYSPSIWAISGVSHNS